jgi:hypothetical protein
MRNTRFPWAGSTERTVVRVGDISADSHALRSMSGSIDGLSSSGVERHMVPKLTLLLPVKVSLDSSVSVCGAAAWQLFSPLELSRPEIPFVEWGDCQAGEFTFEVYPQASAPGTSGRVEAMALRRLLGASFRSRMVRSRAH